MTLEENRKDRQGKAAPGRREGTALACGDLRHQQIF